MSKPDRSKLKNPTGFRNLSGLQVGYVFKGIGIKHKWEPPFWSCSHFVAFELLRPRRQTTVMWLAAFSSASCLRIPKITFNPSRSDSAFYSITFRLSFRYFLAEYLPGRSVVENTVWFISRDLYFCCMEHFGLCSF